MRSIAAVVLLLLFAPAVRAQPPESGSYWLRGALGYATQSLGDVNDDIAMDAATYRPLSTSLAWDEFGNAAPFGLEFGYQYSERWSWAFGFTWHKTTVKHAAQLDFVDQGSGVTYVGQITEDDRLKLLDLYGTALLWIPGASGLHVGAQLGFALGSLDFSDGIDVTGNDGSFADIDGNGEGHASGFSAGVYAGYEVAITETWAISARGGYLLCDLGKMDGREHLLGTTNQGPVDAMGTGHLTNNDGEALDWDFSGLRASAAVTYRFRWGGEF